ncbi:DgyrCDS13052 [Dimorphilus gyrociliatus]|uniref:DgyrCDS13052 n=1 Tax=Dimorphilus gyrociliatus TaxID=2664684 RepID=A0A7I8W9I2_9ANNE|nr:DgyrCDS13052 [Dimorphilus gyrociliatus]
MSKNGLDAICAKLQKNAVKKEVERDYNFNEAPTKQEKSDKKKNRRKTTVPRCLIPSQDDNYRFQHNENTDYDDSESLSEFGVNSVKDSINDLEVSSGEKMSEGASSQDENDNELRFGAAGQDFKEMAEFTVSEFLKKYGFAVDSSSSAAAAMNLNRIEDQKTIKQPIMKMEIDDQEWQKDDDTENSGSERSKSPNSSRDLDNYFKTIYRPEEIEQKNSLMPDYSRYVTRYESGKLCGRTECIPLKEHFHCNSCKEEDANEFNDGIESGDSADRIFLKKEEMIRHFKWHKKRDEILNFGFLRYSPVDDCTRRFEKLQPCIHKGRQTHYHCLHPSCTKVYISTSDVQMHSNFHRKDSAILQEGFQRFRATEDCGMPSCAFKGHRTTHFHCLREGCGFTFKNKADMEKHKVYHQKDEILSRDGFKKFMKYENCGFSECKYSKVINHIHCIRPGCDYILHSTGQLYSHKRKHERNEEKTDEEEQSTNNPSSKQNNETTSPPPLQPPAHQPSQSLLSTLQMGLFPMLNIDNSDKKPNLLANLTLPVQIPNLNSISPSHFQQQQHPNNTAGIKGISGEQMTKISKKLISSNAGLNDSLTLPIDTLKDSKGDSDLSIKAVIPNIKTIPSINEKKEKNENWKKYLARYTANDKCTSRCEYLYKDHYHCLTPSCGQIFRSKDGVREHARLHENQDVITSMIFQHILPGSPCSFEDCQVNEEHYHCQHNRCNEIVKSAGDVFARLDHYRMHDASSSRSGRRNTLKESSNSRRRGRPPKYPKSEIPQVPRVPTKSDLQWLNDARNPGVAPWIRSGFEKFVKGGSSCPDYKCPYHNIEHYHCVRERCFTAVDRFDVLDLHAKTFHGQVIIQEGFEYFDRSVDCRRAHCPNNKNNKHFHCTRSKCDYSFIRPATMSHHSQKHEIHEAIEAKKAVICEQLQSAVINVDKDNKLASETPAKHSWESLKVSMQYTSDRGCGKPFCKMKRKLHFHCSYCSQTYSEEEKLKVHVVDKHNVPINDNTQTTMVKNNNNNNYHTNNNDKNAYNNNSHVNNFSNSNDAAAKVGIATKRKANSSNNNNNNNSYNNHNTNSSNNNNNNNNTSHNENKTLKFIKEEISEEALDLSIASKRPKLELPPSQNPLIEKLAERSNLKVEKDQEVSEGGFIKFKFSDDCSVEKCSYRLSGSHYHCSKPDCLYSFTDKGKGEQHLLRHKKIDEVIGSDFKLIRSHQSCPDDDCNISQAHYHCIRCNFSCTDRGKVVAHRNIHKAVDGFQDAGFVKVKAGDPCDEHVKEIIKCTYSGKCIHFHCLKCTFITLNSTQIRQHLDKSNH